MGKIEENVRKRAKKQNIQYAILTTVKLAGILSVALVAPNTLQLLSYVQGRKKHEPSRIKESLRRLENRGFVNITKSRHGPVARLTRAGESQLSKLTTGDIQFKKPKRWDKKWRIVIFDIQERHRRMRDHLRFVLGSIGFKKLQGSVWIFPYDCEDLVMLLKREYAFGKEVLYMVVEEIEEDTMLRKHFKL